MYHAIILSVRVPEDAGVTLRDGGTWECFSNPKGAFPEKAGRWIYSLASGGQTTLQGTSGKHLYSLAGLKFSDARKGQEGAVLGLEVEMSLGTYLVTQVVE